MKNKKSFEKYIQFFLEENSKLNLISKNDEKYLWEKHIYDSISIEKFFDKYQFENCTLLDIGTGGGFPSVPIAISYPKIQVYALDSIRKKINAVENIKKNLDLKNLTTICDRAENIDKKFDIITSRAVTSIKNILKLAIPLLKDDGFLICYKSIKAQEEIKEAKNELKKYKSEVKEIIQYELPIEEKFIRNLVIIQKRNKDY